MITPQSQRTCPGVDGRPCGIFVPVVDRDPHSMCAQCCGVKHDGILTCDSSINWTEDRWENFNRKKKKLCRQDYSSKSSLSGSAFGSFFPAEHSRQAFVMSCCTVTPQPVSGNNDAVPNLLLSDSLDALAVFGSGVEAYNPRTHSISEVFALINFMKKWSLKSVLEAACCTSNYRMFLLSSSVCF